MTTRQYIEERVIAIVAEQFKHYPGELLPEKITRDTNLYDELDCDSLDWVDLVMECEDAFELAIPDDDAETWRTVGDMIDYVAGAVPDLDD